MDLGRIGFPLLFPPPLIGTGGGFEDGGTDLARNEDFTSTEGLVVVVTEEEEEQGTLR